MKKGSPRPKAEKNKAPIGQVFLFPGPEGWESWGMQGGQINCMGPAPVPKKLKPPAGAILCLPSRAFLSVPLWAPVVEETPAKDLAALALERRGLLGASPESAVWSMEPIRTQALASSGQEEPAVRQLDASAVLGSPFEEDWIVEEASRYEVAGRVLTPPSGGSSAIMRRELGRWVVDFYANGKWLHSQPMLQKEIGGAMAVELKTLLAQLGGEGVIEDLQILVLRDNETHSGTTEFLGGLSFPSRVESRMPPRLSAQPWNLPPPTLTERRSAKAERAKQRKMLQAGMWVYGAVLALALVYFCIPFVRLKMMERQLSSISADAEKIRAAAMAWRETGALVNPQMNVLAVLWEASRPLVEKDPALIEGVRLTQFEYNGKHVFLTGEGKDLEQTEKYFNWLKSNKELALYQWSHPQPRLLPNGNAQFQAEGIPPGVSTKEGEEGGTDANANGS